MSLTPVCVFAYKRPMLTRQVLERVAQSGHRRVYFFCDGPKSQAPSSEREAIQQVRALTEEFSERLDLRCILADENLGLRRSILQGLDYVFDRHEECIILEDDCLPSLSFFDFCSDALQAYRSTDRVAIISGTNFAPDKRKKKAVFCSDPEIWGWATWRRTWRSFRTSPDFDLHQSQKALNQSFGSARLRRSFNRMIQKHESLDSWAISFSIWFRLNRKLAVKAPLNLVRNIGFGNDSTHTKFESFSHDVREQEMDGTPIFSLLFDDGFEHELQEQRAKLRRGAAFAVRRPIETAKRFIRYFWTRKTSGHKKVYES